MLLEISGLTKTFGGLKAVGDFDIQVAEGEIVGLIGPNGAGKSTVFNLITGVLPVTSGTITFRDIDITHKQPDRVAALGIGRTFQLNPLFPEFTVLQNVTSSFQLHPHSSLLDIFFSTPRYRHNERFIADTAHQILEIVGLSDEAGELARNLAHGHQKMLGVARALATKPTLLLLDEPLAGMNPSEIQHSLDAIRGMRENGMTVLIVEHNMQILTLCDRVVVISFGQKICEGLPEEVRTNQEVISAYFGADYVVEIKDISVYYNKSVAIKDVSVDVPEGGVVTIIGANGAGKSTVLKALVGLVAIRAGDILFGGESINGLETADRVKKGIVLVPEGRQLFPYLPVLTNLKLGATLRRDKRAISQSLDYVFELFPRLKERRKQDAGTLSGGEQQMLAIGRGLMADPRLLCLDEPSVGLAPIVVELVGDVIRKINKEGISVLLVEQNAHLALGVCQTGYVLEVGKVVMNGDAEAIRCSDIVRRAYLGGEE